MGTIESAAKPILTQLILGNKFALSVEAQHVIANWLTLKTIIGEFDDPETAAINAQTHRWYYENQTPPPDWKIWIGYYVGEQWRMRYRHHGLTSISRVDYFKGGVARPAKRNMQITTFVAGHLFCHVFSTDHVANRGYGFIGNAGERLRAITGAEPITWPLPLIVDDQTAILVSDAILSRLGDEFG